MKTLRPKKLFGGETVGLIAPAFSFKPDVAAQGRAFLESKYGVKTAALESVYAQDHYFAGPDERRIEEFCHWLLSDEAQAVVAIRGGYGCSRLYPQVLKRLKARRRLKPKIVVGYSDLTIFLNGLHQDLGWVTFHGPVLTGHPFREPLPLEENTFRHCLFSDEPLGAIAEPSMSAYVAGKGRGPLVGGCLSLLVSSLGTPYEVETRGKILFIEEVEERPYRIDRMMMQLLHAGKLNRIRGLIVGQMHRCEPYPEERDPARTTAEEAILLAIGPFLKQNKIPTVFGFPAGHGRPQITFPIGLPVEIHAEKIAPRVVFLKAGAQ